MRDERLLGAECTSDLRRIVLSMVLALNGIEHPESTKNLNIYLSSRQRSALEKTLLIPEATRESLIGQAVALIVIYRWYAPQLVDQFRISYPEKTEQKTLNHLSDTLADWPKSITTD